MKRHGLCKGLVLLVALISFYLVADHMFFSQRVYAESVYYSDEKYTASDYLLLDDGTLSEKTIHDWARKVKSLGYGVEALEIAPTSAIAYSNSTAFLVV